jgi:hypothetical protein
MCRQSTSDQADLTGWAAPRRPARPRAGGAAQAEAGGCAVERPHSSARCRAAGGTRAGVALQLVGQPSFGVAVGLASGPTGRRLRRPARHTPEMFHSAEFGQIGTPTSRAPPHPLAGRPLHRQLCSVAWLWRCACSSMLEQNVLCATCGSALSSRACPPGLRSGSPSHPLPWPWPWPWPSRLSAHD